MNKTEVEAYADFEVYVNGKDGKTETLCLCNSHTMATNIAKCLAMAAKEPFMLVYVSGVYYGGEMIPGGGWYEIYWRDENGKLYDRSVS